MHALATPVAWLRLQGCVALDPGRLRSPGRAARQNAQVPGLAGHRPRSRTRPRYGDAPKSLITCGYFVSALGLQCFAVCTEVDAPHKLYQLIFPFGTWHASAFSTSAGGGTLALVMPAGAAAAPFDQWWRSP